MLRFKLKERIADKEFREGRRLTIQEVAGCTGITRNTLSKMLKPQGASVRTENLDRLCAYFECRIEELVEYVPDAPARGGSGDRAVPRSAAPVSKSDG